MKHYSLIISDNCDISIMEYEDGCNIDPISTLHCIKHYSWYPDELFEDLLNRALKDFRRLKENENLD